MFTQGRQEARHVKAPRVPLLVACLG